jgi:hypothetical protein
MPEVVIIFTMPLSPKVRALPSTFQPSKSVQSLYSRLSFKLVVVIDTVKSGVAPSKVPDRVALLPSATM